MTIMITHPQIKECVCFYSHKTAKKTGDIWPDIKEKFDFIDVTWPQHEWPPFSPNGGRSKVFNGVPGESYISPAPLVKLPRPDLTVHRHHRSAATLRRGVHEQGVDVLTGKDFNKVGGGRGVDWWRCSGSVCGGWKCLTLLIQFTLSPRFTFSIQFTSLSLSVCT